MYITATHTYPILSLRPPKRFINLSYSLMSSMTRYSGAVWCVDKTPRIVIDVMI